MKYVLLVLSILYTQTSLASDPPLLDKPYTWQRVKEYHKHLGSAFFPSLQRMIEVDLNKDGLNERFMLIRPYARGGTYLLFLYHDAMWHPLTEVEMSHLPIKILNNSNNTWHEFVTYVPQWRGKLVWQFHYVFSGSNYYLRQKRDIEWP